MGTLSYACCIRLSTAGSRSGRPRAAGDITFVHADGHIETFRTRDNAQDRHSGDSESVPASATPRPTRPASSAGDVDADSVMGDNRHGEEILGDCPPSYEEALQMPTPLDSNSPLYVNLDSKEDDNHMT